MQNYIVTIARGFVSGGKEIGTKLGLRLGIPCYEREILTMASQKNNIDESLFVDKDEKLKGNYIVNWLRKNPSIYICEPQENDFVSDNNLFQLQAELIRDLAETQSCIIVGKCADDILKDYRNVISVYVEAPRDACVKSICSKMYVSEERANQLIRKTDKYRANYYNYYTGGKEWTNPVNYDLVLNSDRAGRDNCVEILISYLRIRKFIP